MSISGIFSASARILSILGDGRDNGIVISRDASGHILANGGAIAIAGGVPETGNTSLILAHGGNGDDTIALDETSGPLPAAQLFGENGNDRLTGGGGNDQLFGGNGKDILSGGGGNDQLFGGNGNDTINGGAGADQFFGGNGNDLLIWNPGDGSDRLDGGLGTDEMLFNGNGNPEDFVLTAEAGGALFTRAQGTIAMDLTSVEKVTVNALAGADTVHIFDPSGTGVSEIDINLGVNGAGDGAADKVFINDDDALHVTNDGGGNLTITGVSGAVVHITGFETANDQLVINGDLFHL